MRYRLSHDLASYKLPRAFAFRSDNPGEDQDAIVQRLLDYYVYMKAEAERLKVPGLAGIWSHFSGHFKAFEQALESGKVDLVSEALLKVCTTPLVSGFASYHQYEAILRDPRARMFESYLTVDRMLSLAEAVGAAAPQCPFQILKSYHDLDIGALITNVKKRIPFDIDPPKAGGGTFGIRTVDGVISISDILAMYVADRIHGILQRREDKSVCEIGGGTGTLAYYLTKTCASKISVGDLPIVSIIQGYYLMKGAGIDNVRLSGEPHSDRRVHVMPYWELSSLPSKSVSLFVNVDSMPEIDLDIAQSYINTIKRVGQLFLSVNQEAEYAGQSVVRNLVENAGGYQKIHRFPYWMIAGYCEELFEIAS